MIKCAVLDINGKESESVNLPESFEFEVNNDVIHQAVIMYQASQRAGLASIKTRAEVSGGGKKPWRQKGTGRARQGSIRSPLWHKGGVVFGPQPRDFSYSLSKKIKRAALRETLNDKYHGKTLLCIEDLKQAFKKTKEFSEVLGKLKVQGKVLAILDGSDKSVERASRNIRGLTLMRSADVNAYDVLRNKYLLVSKTGLKKLLDRVK